MRTVCKIHNTKIQNIINMCIVIMRLYRASRLSAILSSVFLMNGISSKSCVCFCKSFSIFKSRNLNNSYGTNAV